jgi:hypothetical protein
MTVKNAEKKNPTEALSVTIVSKAFSVTVKGVGRSISLGAIAALTLLGALYLYLTFLA